MSATTLPLKVYTMEIVSSVIPEAAVFAQRVDKCSMGCNFKHILTGTKYGLQTVATYIIDQYVGNIVP